MRPVTETRRTNAAIGAVLRAVSEVGRLAEAIPHIVNAELLTASRTGVGTRFRETRTLNGKSQTTGLEVNEHAEIERVRRVADGHGAVRDTVFAVKQAEGHVEMVVEARPRKPVPEIMYLLFRRVIRKAVEKDVDSVRKCRER